MHARATAVAGVAVATAVVLAAVTAVTWPALHRHLDTIRPAGSSDATPPTPGASPSPSSTPGPLRLAARPVTLPTGADYTAWALAAADGTITARSGNADTDTTSTESMIKAWLVADALRRNPHPDDAAALARYTAAIVDSDDQAAETIYREAGGDATITRAITTCHLTHTRAVAGWWSRTTITATDAARLGVCLADGRAAGPDWTPWLLDQMRAVHGEGRFGAVDAYPAAGLAIKNGWTRYDEGGEWRVNCLAIGAGWTLAVLLRYDLTRGLSYGARTCAAVTAQLADPGPAGH